MASEKSDLLQGTLDMLVLKIVALGPAHGYGNRAPHPGRSSRAVLQVQQGSLYPALHRLEKRGWLKAEWRPSETGREAKFYSLTRAGRKQLESETANWDRLAGAVELILKGRPNEPSGTAVGNRKSSITSTASRRITSRRAWSRKRLAAARAWNSAVRRRFTKTCVTYIARDGWPTCGRISSTPRARWAAVRDSWGARYLRSHWESERIPPFSA